MLKRFGLTAFTLASALAISAPTVSLARDHDDHRGAERHEYRANDFRGGERHDYGRRDYDRGRLGFSFGYYAAPPVVTAAPPANGFYDAYGVWHPYGYYDQFGVYHSYGY